MSDAIEQSFDYASLTGEARVAARTAAVEIRQKLDKASASIVEIGERLIAVKEAVGHGAFLKWIQAEFQWSKESAQRMMRVAEYVKNVNLTHLEIQPSALYLLASKNIPEEAKEAIQAKAATGAKVTHADVKKAVTAAKPPAGVPSKPCTPVAAKPAESAAEIEPLIEQSPAAPTDALGRAIPESLLSVWAAAEVIDGLISQSRSLKMALGKHLPTSKSPPADGFAALARPQERIREAIRDIEHYLVQARPTLVCVRCEGSKCAHCHNLGYVTKDGMKNHLKNAVADGVLSESGATLRE